MAKTFYVTLELLNLDGDDIPTKARVVELFQELLPRHTPWVVDDVQVYEWPSRIGGPGRRE
jgi:hypothetical protein